MTARLDEERLDEERTIWTAEEELSDLQAHRRVTAGSLG